MNQNSEVIQQNQLKIGMIGLGMIFEETYRPFFEHAAIESLCDHRFGLVDVGLSAIGSRTGTRAQKLIESDSNE